MAKKRKVGAAQEPAPTVGSGVEATVVGFAEDLGKILGTAQTRAEGWLNQRKAIATQLAQIRDAANQYLQQLAEGGANIAAAVRGRKGRPPGSKNKRGPGRPAGTVRKKRTMSAEAREKIAEAQRKRWAKQKKAKAAE